MDWFNRKYYYLKTIFLYFVVIALMMMYKTPMYNLFDNYILPVLTITEYDWLLLVFIISALFIALYVIIKAIKAYQLSFFRIVTHISLLIVYGYFRYLACTTNIYIFRPSNDEIGYIDIIFLVLAISLISPWIVTLIKFIWKFFLIIFDWFLKLIKRPRKKQDNNYDEALLTDLPLTDPKQDKLGYTEFAIKLANKIKGVPQNTACSLGIIAEWGVGKSTVINFIELYLDKNKFIVIRFNPRHSFNSSRIQEDFYSFISSELKEYNSIFSTIFIDYMKGAGIIGRNNTIQILLNSYKVWNKEGESARINNAIKNLNKRVVVIIEDLDRLLAEEIIEVFKIIDNNSITNNIIFISAYDKEYINKILGRKYKHQDSMFSDKFFNWEVYLPLIAHIKIIEFLVEKLEKELKNDSMQFSFSATLNNNSTIIKSYIKTIRDAKRFLNTLIEVYIHKRDVINFEDLFLITLVKFKHPTEHSKIFNKEYVIEQVIEERNKYILKDNIPSSVKSKDILEKLFRIDRKKDFLSINNKNAFTSYFYYYANRIDIEQLRSLIESENIEVSYEQLRAWNEADKTKQVLEYFNEINILTFNEIDNVYKYIDILLFMMIEFNVDIREYIRIFFLKSHRKEICKKYGIEESDFKQAFQIKLKGDVGKYPHSLMRELIINIIDRGGEDYIFTKTEIQEITRYHIDNYIDNKKDIAENLEIELLYENIDNIEPTSRLITLNPEVCNKVKEYIKGNPDFYIKQFVRNGISSSSKYFFILACEPFWDQIFGSKDKFNMFINTHELDEKENIQLVRNFWKLYEAHNYKPIEFDNQGITYEEAISDQLLSLSSDAIRIKEIGDIAEKTNESGLSALQKISEFEKLSIELENINLYIRKKGKVSETITRFTRQIKIQTIESSKD